MSVIAGPSRGPDTWQPKRYLEPNHPDNEEVQEQASYQAALTRMGNEERKKRYKPRRTVDYQGPMLKWRQLTKLKGIEGYLPPIHPNPSDIIGLLPPEAHRLNSSTSICDHFVHTSINKERSPTRVVKWTPDARRLLTGNDKGQFTLWNGSSFNYESITQVHDDSIQDLAYSHNGQALVSVDRLGMIKYFTPHLTNIHGFEGHREACHGISWSPNDERFVTGGDDGLVKIWSYREAKEERALTGHGWDVRCVDWHPTKGLVVSGSKDMLVKFWDPRSGRALSTLHSHKAVVFSAKWNPNGHIVATAGGDGMIRLFDIRTFRELEPMKGHAKEVKCLEWHPTHSNLLVSGDAAGAMIYWSLQAPDPSVPLTIVQEAHDDAINSLAFHPLGHILCSGSKDYTARFWCRARPMGGQENDRWHIGEDRAWKAKVDEDEGRNSKWPGLPDSKEDLPGLPGLGGQGSRDGERSTSLGMPGRIDLPGFGGEMPASRSTSSSAPGPPIRNWAADPMTATGGMRSTGPLPSQGDMLRHNGSGERDRQGYRDVPPPRNQDRYSTSPGPSEGYASSTGGYGSAQGYGGPRDSYGQNGNGHGGGYANGSGRGQGRRGYGDDRQGYGGPSDGVGGYGGRGGPGSFGQGGPYGGQGGGQGGYGADAGPPYGQNGGNGDRGYNDGRR